MDMEASSKDCECGLLSLATETLLDIVSYLTAYERLCLRITCKRLRSILSDSRAWHTLVWRDCRRRDSDFKALRLALRLAMATVQSVAILYPSTQKLSFSKFFPQLHSCKQVRYLTLSCKLPPLQMLERLLSQLPSLYFFSITEVVQGTFSAVSAEAKNLKILQLVRYSDFGVSGWKACGYFPPNLQVCDSSLSSGIELSWLSRSDHPAKFSIYPKCSSVAGNLVNKYPLLEIVLHPNVKVVSCVCPSSHESPLLTLCNGRTCLSSEENCEYVSATYHLFRGSSLPGNSLPFLPPTIQSLCLDSLACLTSADLSSISECCPNLRCLNIKGCQKALLSLSGLADISEKCQLINLNIQSISNVESVATLWEVLASMRKLRHLAMNGRLLSPNPPSDEHCLSCIRSSASKMSLTAFETSNDSGVLQLDTLLPALYWLKHLRISGYVPRLTNILPNIPHLTHL